ncbi:MAG: septum formation initiator family protein [Alphaproteobacteria bacterium]|nr:septum formation initiator family protein [Alphaproteobacteria bacterium]
MLATLSSFGLFVYFCYFLLHGNMGYFALRGLDDKLASAQAEYDQVHAARMALEKRVVQLRPGSINPDMLDERARVVLGYAAPDERVVTDPE